MTRPPDDSVPRSEATETILRAAPPPLGAIIRISGVPTSRSELRLAAGSWVVGAGTEADIIVEDRAVSKYGVK